MSWVKLDDGFPQNPKIVGLSDHSFRLYISGLCYSGRYLTDGFIPAAIIKQVGDPRELIEKGLWQVTPDGIQIANYTEYQTPKSVVERKREQNRDRVMRYREKSNADVTHPEYRIQNTENRSNTSSNKFDEFWNLYPRKVGKQDARKAFERALRNASLEEIFEGLQRFVTDPNRVLTFTPHPATWLNQGRWGDDPIPPRNVENSYKASPTPTPTPPRFTAEEIQQGVPMPDELKVNLRNILKQV
jgi:hypothetical protein